MKTKQLFLAVLVATSSLLATASGKTQINIQSINANQVLVTVKTEKADQLEVSIFDDENNIVYFKKSRKPITTTNKIFDVENLENGNYSLELKINNLIYSRTLKISDDRLIVGLPQEYTAPYFEFTGNRLIVTHLNFKNEKFKLSIYNKDGLVYNKSIGNSTSLNAGFNLTNLEEGSYVVILNSGYKEFEYNFKK